MNENNPTAYQPFLKEILSKIQLARYEMLKTVSKQTVTLYRAGKMGQISCGATF